MEREGNKAEIAFSEAGTKKLHRFNETFMQARALVEDLENGDEIMSFRPNYYLQRIRSMMEKFQSLFDDPEFDYLNNEALADDWRELEERVSALEEKYRDYEDQPDKRLASPEALESKTLLEKLKKLIADLKNNFS